MSERGLKNEPEQVCVLTVDDESMRHLGTILHVQLKYQYCRRSAISAQTETTTCQCVNDVIL